MEKIPAVKSAGLTIITVGVYCLIHFFTLKFDLFQPDYSRPILRVLLTLLLAWMVIRLSGNRFSDLGWQNYGTFFTGIGVASLFILMVIASAWLGGAVMYTPGQVAAGQDVLYLAFLFAAVAVGEEVLYTGILFGVLQRGIGIIGAALISQSIFAIMHLLNQFGIPDTLGVAILFLGGCFSVALYVGSKSLWMPIGAHLAWNYVQISALRCFSYTGSVWARESFFGLEAWPLTLCLLIPLLAVTSWWAYRRRFAEEDKPIAV